MGLPKTKLMVAPADPIEFMFNPLAEPLVRKGVGLVVELIAFRTVLML
jgi:hypothetical protein